MGISLSRKLRAIADPIGFTIARKNKNTWWGKRYLHPGKNLRKDLGLKRLFGSKSSVSSTSAIPVNSARTLSSLYGGS